MKHPSDNLTLDLFSSVMEISVIASSSVPPNITLPQTTDCRSYWLHGALLESWVRLNSDAARDFFFLDPVPGFSQIEVVKIREMLIREPGQAHFWPVLSVRDAVAFAERIRTSDALHGSMELSGRGIDADGLFQAPQALLGKSIRNRLSASEASTGEKGRA